MAQVMTAPPPVIDKTPTLRAELEFIYDACAAQLLACAVAIVGCRDRAEDAIHEAFCRLLKLDERPRNLKAFAFRSVRNAAIDILRRDGRFVELDENLFVSGAAGPLESAQTNEFRAQVAAALGTLPPDERETIIQHVYGGLTLREIAEMRDAPPGTIATWYRRGMDKLRRSLKE